MLTFTPLLLFPNDHVAKKSRNNHLYTMSRMPPDIIFQLCFTIAQGFAIYLVLRCRKYLSAKEHWKKQTAEVKNSQIFLNHPNICDPLGSFHSF